MHVLSLERLRFRYPHRDVSQYHTSLKMHFSYVYQSKETSSLDMVFLVKINRRKAATSKLWLNKKIK